MGKPHIKYRCKITNL